MAQYALDLDGPVVHTGMSKREVQVPLIAVLLAGAAALIMWRRNRD